MKRHGVNNIKLGIFVLAGLAFLILLLYMIGRNKNLFGSSFTLKARFENVQGLVSGNNVRYAGIEIGTVKKIHIINDTLVEVMMVVDADMRTVIKSNALVSIGSDGLMGNKVINIAAGAGQGTFVNEGDVLASRKPLDTDQMLRTLEKTNTDVAVIAANLRNISTRLNESAGLMTLLDDPSLPQHLKAAASNVQLATIRAANMAQDLEIVIASVKDGKGSLGMLVADTAIAHNLNEAIQKIYAVGSEAEILADSIQGVVAEIKYELQEGKGTVNALLKDSLMTQRLNHTLENIEKGTDAFSQNMEALKHNFFFRGYFRKQERQKQKAPTRKVVSH